MSRKTKKKEFVLARYCQFARNLFPFGLISKLPLFTQSGPHNNLFLCFNSTSCNLLSIDLQPCASNTCVINLYNKLYKLATTLSNHIGGHYGEYTNILWYIGINRCSHSSFQSALWWCKKHWGESMKEYVAEQRLLHSSIDLLPDRLTDVSVVIFSLWRCTCRQSCVR